MCFAVSCLPKLSVFLFVDAENFEPDEPIKKAAVMDKWEGEDEEEDVKVCHDVLDFT